MNKLEDFLVKCNDVYVIDNSISYSNYVALDLSVSNFNLEFNSASEFEKIIENHLNKNNAKVAFGGYIEERNLYKRSTIFNDDETEERNIHIGLDLWIVAGTKVLAALDGVVHSFNFNLGLGNYGPTIILKHTFQEVFFYTLYGHLSIESIENLSIGDEFKKGQTLATLGNNDVNGDYAPHLHFQIINNIQDFNGDYPGVCSNKNLDFYLSNCPNPNLLLKIDSGL